MRLSTSFEKLRKNFADYSQIGIVSLLPIAALAGNAPADIAIVLTIVIFFATDKGSIKDYLNSRFAIFGLLFWVWILFASAISTSPKYSFQDSLPWIRFPLYAFALSLLLNENKNKLFKIFLTASIIGSLIQIGTLAIEYIFFRDPGYPRLYGTFSRPIAGWYITCFSLLTIFILFEKIMHYPTSIKYRAVSAFYFIICSTGILLTGEIMMTLFYFGALSLFIALHALRNPKILIVAAGSIALIALILVLDDQLSERIFRSLGRRIPWYPTSDYYSAWKMGLMTLIENPIIGVGPKNTNAYCLNLKEVGTLEQILDLKKCLWHPHNLYLQIGAETGMIGILLFTLIAGNLIWQSIKIRFNGGSAISLSMLAISFFPIQTFSQAFGQSKNFYLWTIIGVCLALNHQHFLKHQTQKEYN